MGGDDTTGGLYFLGWNTKHGDLRVSHFIGMHALQLLPLLALYAAYGARLREGTRLRVAVLFAATYASVTALTLWQALRGKSVINPDAWTLTAAAALALIVAVYTAAVFRRVRQDMTNSAPTLSATPQTAVP